MKKFFQINIAVLVSLIILAIAPADAGSSSSSCKHVLTPKSEFTKVRSLVGEGRERDALKRLAAIESALANEKIVKQKDLGGGVNTTFKVTLDSGIHAVWKPNRARNGKLRENRIPREVAAYRVSTALRLYLVPPTVARKINGEEGTMQLFVDDSIVLKKIPEYQWDKTRTGRWLKVFDWLINNHDRGSNKGNTLIIGSDLKIKESTEDLNVTFCGAGVVGCDHGVAFVSKDKEARQGKKPGFSTSDIRDRELYKRLSAVDRDELKRSMKGLISSSRIRQVMKRYDRLMEKMREANRG